MRMTKAIMKKVIHTIGVGSMSRKEIVKPPVAPRRIMVSRLRRVEDIVVLLCLGVFLSV